MEHIDVAATRREGVTVLERQFKSARTTTERHYARLALQRARRALEAYDAAQIGEEELPGQEGAPEER